MALHVVSTLTFIVLCHDLLFAARRYHGKVRRLAQEAGVQVLIRGTSTLRNLENYRKLMGKKQGTYLKSYGAFLKVWFVAWLAVARVQA